MPGALAQPSLKLSCTGGVWDACPPVTISPSLLCPPVLQRLGDAHQAPLRQRLRRLRPADLRGRQRGGDHREHVPPLLQPRVSFCSGPAPCPCPPPSTQGRVSGTPGGAKGSSRRGHFGSNQQPPFSGRALALCAWSSSCSLLCPTTPPAAPRAELPTPWQLREVKSVAKVEVLPAHRALAGGRSGVFFPAVTQRWSWDVLCYSLPDSERGGFQRALSKGHGACCLTLGAAGGVETFAASAAAWQPCGGVYGHGIPPGRALCCGGSAASPFLGAEGFPRKALRWATLPSSRHVGASRALRVVRGWF